MATAPPRLIRWLLDRLLGDDVRGASIRGDLYEELQARASRQSPGEARRWYRRQAIAVAVRVLFGSRRQGHASSPPRASFADRWSSDVRSAWRALVRDRGFTLAAVVTLALGIGAASAVYSVLDAVLVRPLPYADPDRIAWLCETNTGGARISLAWPDYLDWRARLTSFDDLAAVRGVNLNWTSAGPAERLLGRQVTERFFKVIGVTPAIGRTFTEAEDQVGGRRVAILADEFWRRRFAADPGVIGRTIVLDGEPREIVGVLPRGYRYGTLTLDDVYTPLGQEATETSGLRDRGNHNGLAAVGRLKAGVSLSSASNELMVIGAALTATYPNTNSDTRPEIMAIADRMVGTVAPTLRVLFTAVGFLLLLAAVNVANLLVARGATRRHELAVRAALGCSRWGLARQHLAESLMLGFAGAAGGLAVAAGLVAVLVASAPQNLPRLDDIGMSGRVWIFAFVISLLAALLLSVLPALQATGVGGQAAVVRSGRGQRADASGRRTRRILTIVEVALALVLLTGAGLMARTMAKLSAVDTGFDPSHLLTLRYTYTGGGSDEAAAGRRAEFADRLLARVRTLPGVQHAALTLSLPINGSNWGSVFIVSGQPVPSRPQLPAAAFVPVSDDYFRTIGMTLRSGRAIDATDTGTSTNVAVVNEQFARRFWPNESAIGKRLKQGWPEDDVPWREIVGIVNDVKLDGVDAATPMQVFLPIRQVPAVQLALVVRSAIAPEALTATLAGVVHEVEPSLPTYAAQTMDAIMGAAVSRQRLSSLVLVGFAGVALVIACVGLAGLVTQDVTQRTREIGVRLALGASAGGVLRMFVVQGFWMVTAGAALGLPAALVLSRLMDGLLFGVTATDPVVLAATLGLLAVVALAACYLPARRAAHVDPTIALRGD